MRIQFRKLLLRKSSQRSLCIYVLVLLFVSIAQPQYSPSLALQDVSWSIPQTIPLYDAETWPPILIGDPYGNVHAFSSQWITPDEKSVRAIVYNRWTLENGWEEPVDIMLSPIEEARLTDVILDDQGVFHLVFWGGNGLKADIYYSQARLDDAGNAKMWTTPIIVGEKAGDPENAVLAKNQSGDLILIYHGINEGHGVYVTYTEDETNTWSEPEMIFIANDNAPLIYSIHLAQSKAGVLHLIWDTLTVRAEGRAVSYSKSTNGGINWSDPIQLATAEFGFGVLFPNIIEHDGKLLAFYYEGLKIIMRRSSDDGDGWDTQAMIFPRQVGVNGSLSLLVDSDKNLHLFFGQRISGKPDIHGMWHSMLKNGRWLEPEAVVKGPLVRDEIGSKGFDPFEARGVIVRGNVVLITWRTEATNKGNGVWYSYKLLDSLPMTPKPALSTTSQQINNSLEQLSLTATPSTRALLSDSLPVARQSELKPSDIMLLSGVSSFLFIVIIMVLQNRGRKS